MNIECLPDEILICIFSFIDSCRSLHRACQVSRRWRAIGTIQKNNVSFWRKCCIDDIPEYVLLDLTSGIGVEEYALSCFENEHETLEDKTTHWEKLYRIFSRSCLIDNQEYKETHKEIETGRPVSCVRINGDYVMVGCFNGTLSIWDHLVGDLQLSCYANYRGVTNLELVSDRGMDLSDEDRFGLLTRMVVTSGVDRYVIVHVIDLPHATCDVFWKYECADRIISIRVFGSVMVVAAMDAFLAGVRVLDVKTRSDLYHLYGHQALPYCVDMWQDEVACGSLDGEILFWNLPGSAQCNKVVDEASAVPFHNSIRCVDLTLRGHLIIYLTSNGDFHVYDTKSNKPVKTHFMFPKLQASPTRLCLRGCLLGLGTSAGTCCLYRLTDICSINDRLRTRPLRTIHTGYSTVRDLDISDDGDSPMVALATDSPTLTIVRWYL